MWDRFGAKWERLARSRPLTAILTRAGSAGNPGNYDEAWNLDEFLETGAADARRFVDELMRLAPSVPRRRVLDFGCGIGRVAHALAEYFDEVVGVDVSPTMIARARAMNRSARCVFVLNRRRDLRAFESDRFPVVYSRLVLQHVKPANIRRYIAEMVRVLAPDGMLMFQLPEHRGVDSCDAFVHAPVAGSAIKRRVPKPIVRFVRRMKFFVIARTARGRIRMFGMPRTEVEAIIRGAGGRIISVRSDRSHGTEGSGFEYWISK